LIAVRRGDLEAAELDVEGRVPAGPQGRAYRHLLFAEIALARGRPDEAAACVDRALDVLAGCDLNLEALTAHAFGLQALADQTVRPARSGRRSAVEPTKAARVAESMLAEVERLLAAAAVGGHASPYPVALGAWCRAEASRIHGSDPAAWARAVAAYKDLGAPYHAAYCGFREAEARLHARGDRRAATEALLEAWRTARRLDARDLVTRCERLAERGRIVLDDPHDDSATPRQRAAADLALTTREVEVLDLLARRRTDAQIAEELFVSKKTASVHVSNVVRKLDAHDRWHAGDIGRNAGLGDTD
jgi:DNA-binding CsgD family transcriptional regulator